VHGKGKNGRQLRYYRRIQRCLLQPLSASLGAPIPSPNLAARVAPAITLVTATPVKKPPPRAKSNVSARSSSPIHNIRSSSPHLAGRSSSPHTSRSSSLTPLDTDDSELPSASVPLLDFSSDNLGNTLDEDEDAEGEIWLPNSSLDVLLLSKSGWGAGTNLKKRVPSAASEVLTSDTPVRKRMRLGR
jgi:hypothetical protein